METNNSDVITAVSAEKARELLDHAALIEDALTDLTGEEARSRNARIGDLNNELGLTLKLAHIHATLAVADAIARPSRIGSYT